MLRSNELGAAIDMPLNGIWLALDLLDFFPIYILSRLTRRVCVCNENESRFAPHSKHLPIIQLVLVKWID